MRVLKIGGDQEIRRFLKMKKIITLSLLLTLTLAGCGLETKTLDEFYPNNLDDVTQIVIVDGRSGKEKTETNKESIKGFIKEIEDIKFIPKESQEPREGWLYSIKLYSDKEEIFQFGPTKINENYYHTEPDIYPVIDDFYNGQSD